MRWRETEETTEIIITSEKPELDAIEKRPHITCVLGSARWSGIGLDQLQSQRASDGQRTHTDLMPSTMAFHCQAKEGLVARRIAWNASFYTVALRRILMRQGGLHEVSGRHDISAESGLTAFTGPKSESDLVSVVVTVPFYWQPQWRIKRAATLFRNVEMALNVNQASPMYSPGRTMHLRPPMVKGRPVETVPMDPPQDPAFIQEVTESNYGEEE
jgi:hypothetical protein